MVIERGIECERYSALVSVHQSHYITNRTHEETMEVNRTAV